MCQNLNLTCSISGRPCIIAEWRISWVPVSIEYTERKRKCYRHHNINHISQQNYTLMHIPRVKLLPLIWFSCTFSSTSAIASSLLSCTTLLLSKSWCSFNGSISFRSRLIFRPSSDSYSSGNERVAVASSWTTVWTSTTKSKR